MRKHNFFSNLAFNLAENNLGKTKLNPSVGCLIVKDDSVISSGVTSINGRPHAEVNALKKKINFKGSSMYLTLEPCTHFGLTPPCTNIIKQKKIKEVFFAFNDPDKRTYKRAQKILKKKKVNLKKIKIKNCDFYKSYFINKKNELPCLDAKIAISKDYYSINKKSKWITNKRSRKVGHLLRSKYDCILSTSKTINKDNALLNCRISGLDDNQPDLIIIDRNFKLKKNLKLFKNLKKRNIYIFTSKITNNLKMKYFKKLKISILKIDKLNEKNDFLILMKKIFSIGKRRVLVESGLTFLTKLLRFKHINDLYVFKSNNKLIKNGRNIFKNTYVKKINSRNISKVNLNQDKLFKIRIR